MSVTGDWSFPMSRSPLCTKCRASENKIALIQMQCGAEPEANLAKAIDFIRRGRADRGADRLSAGVVPLAIFLPVGGSREFRAGRRNSRADDAVVGESRAGDWRGHRRVAFRETHRWCLSQHRGDHRRRRQVTWGSIARCISRMIPSYYEKFYFTPGDLGFQAWPDRAGKDRRLRLLGPMVSGGRATNRASRRGDSCFIRRRSDGIQPRKQKYGDRATFRLGNDAAQSRDREWLLRRGGRIASATKRRPVAMGSSSGDKA